MLYRVGQPFYNDNREEDYVRSLRPTREQIQIVHTVLILRPIFCLPPLKSNGGFSIMNRKEYLIWPERLKIYY